jgi:hypothetical protein
VGDHVALRRGLIDQTEEDRQMISIQTRTDAHNAVLNSGHRDRFAIATQFNVAVTTVWLSVRNGVITEDQLDAICDKIVDAS